MSDYEGFEHVRTYGPGEAFPKDPDFTHMADASGSWDEPEDIHKAWAGMNASVAVYRVKAKKGASDVDV